MTDKTWAEVDDYLTGALLAPDPVLDDALADSAAAGLPHIAVAPNQGKLLNLLARQAGARSILEIGTLGGYSTIWLARALPAGGKLVTCGDEPKHPQAARGHPAPAGLGEDGGQIKVGAAPRPPPAPARPFGLLFCR